MAKEEKKLKLSTLKKVFFRHYALQAGANAERQQSLGYAYLMMPALLELYKDDNERLKAGVKRHLEFFNCAVATTPFVAGVSCAMEEQNANSDKDEFEADSINAVKLALMGPLAGIGDSFFWGTFRIIGVGIGAALALEGNILGPILYFLMNVIPSTLVRVYGFKAGYRGGNNFLMQMSEKGSFVRLTEASKIMGLLVVGSMIASMVNIELLPVFDFAGSEIVIQDILNTICPGILPLGLVFACYRALQKKISPMIILLALLLLSIFVVAIGLI